MRKAAVWVLGSVAITAGLIVAWYLLLKPSPAKAPEPMPAPPVYVAPAPAEPEQPVQPKPADASSGRRIILCIRNAAVEQPMAEECEV